MSDDDKPESMRPIPDGGLQEAMPAWLKRPPAWRNLPTAEERFERSLPEPDTSTIDPRSLVDITDLPQWLQTIAARQINIEPEPAVEHAIEQVQHAEPKPVDAVSVGVESVLLGANIETEPITTLEQIAVPTLVEPESARPNTAILWTMIAVLVLAVLILGVMQFL